jgi:hypothetical protein
VAVAIVLEKNVATANACDKEVLGAFVVHIRECSANADSAGQPDSSLPRDVLELATAQIFPEFVAANLIRKIDVEQSVAVDIGDCNCISVIVVAGPLVRGNVVHCMVNERDSARLQLIAE